MFVGPMPPREFLDTLLPVAPKHLDGLPDINFSSIPTTMNTTESAMYKPLVDEFNRCCPGFLFYVASHNTNYEWTLRPNIGMLKGTRPPKKTAVRGGSNKSTTKAQASATGSSNSSDLVVFDWERSELCCEVKANVEADAFNDKNISMAADVSTWAGVSQRGQLLSYFNELAVRQHRTFVFSLFIFGPWARFLRFDRSGCIVSARFNYKRNPRPLVEFLWRYSHLDERARGWDPTRSLASRQDTRLYQKQIALFLKGERPAIIPSSPTPESTTPPSPAAASSRPSITSTLPPRVKPAREGPRTFASSSETIEMVERIKADTEGRTQADYPAYTVDVKYKNSKTTTLIIQRPVRHSFVPFGHGTRSYLAYDKSNNAICFFRDYWRVVLGGHQSEAEAYDVLYEKNVCHLPNVLCAEDVVDGGNVQTTYTDTLIQGAAKKALRKSCRGLRSLQHHHVVEDVLYPLSSFESSRELVGIIMDVMEGVEDARVNAGIIHRDISCGKIMITADGDGVLNAWYSSGPVVPDPHREIGAFRNCSWQFMAVALLQNSRRRNEVWHDVESLSLWCLLYIALHHLPHVWRNNLNRTFPMDMFDDMDDAPPRGNTTIFTAGSRKLDFLISGKIRDLHFPTAPPLNALLRQICDEFGELYHASCRRELPDIEERYQKTLANLNNPMYMHAKFKEAYDSKDWLDKNDWVPDRYPLMRADLESLQQLVMDDHDDPREVSNMGFDNGSEESNDAAGSSLSGATRKRGAEAGPDTDASGAPLRRSKRLKDYAEEIV